MIDLDTQSEYVGGTFVETLNLVFLPNDGYEFISWDISGNCEYCSNSSAITIQSLSTDTTLSVILRNYSTSTCLINTVDVDEMPVPGETLVNVWSFASSNLDMSGSMWYGCPSTPLIVGEYTYVRAGGYLYCIETATGHISKYVRSEGLANNFYHYISYGDGVIFDTTGYKAYDLELNYLYDIPTSLRFATYYDGYFYGCLKSVNGFQMYKTSADPNSDLDNGVKINLFSNKTEYLLWAQYGQYSSFLIEGDWIFFPEADGDTTVGAYRAITAFNIKTEESATVELPGIGGLPWDDGWLTYYDDYLYITAYVAGLFGGVPEDFKDYYDTIAYVKFDSERGCFEDPNYKLVTTPSGSTFRGVCSGLIIHDGRGYVNARSLGTDTLGGSDDANTCMIAYDIGENGEPIPRYATPSVMGHGGLVINTAYEEEGKVYVYFLPYNKMSQGVYVFTDELIDGVWVFKDTYDILSPTRMDWGSQAVRVGANGELVYYVDSGYLDCYVSADRFKITVMEMIGDTASVTAACGANVGVVLEKLHVGSSIEEGVITWGYSSYYIYGLNEASGVWDLISDPYTQQYTGKTSNGVVVGAYKYVILLDINSEKHFSSKGEQGWYYYTGSEYSKITLYDTKSIDATVGTSLHYFKSAPSVSDYVLSEYIFVNRESYVEFELPLLAEFGYEVSDGTVISVEEKDNKLIITGLKESEVLLTIHIGENTYQSTVKVQPKVTVIDENNTITESITVNNGVMTISTITVSVTSEGTESKNLTCSYDVDGNMIRSVETNVLNTRELDPENPNQTIPITYTSTIEKDSNGNKIVDEDIEKTYVSKQLERGSRVITTELVERDNLSGDITRTVTVVTTDSIYAVTLTTVTKYSEGIVVSESIERSVDTADEAISVTLEDSLIEISINGATTIDLRTMIESIAEGYEGEMLVIGSQSVSADVVTAASEAGATMILQDNSAMIHLSNESLNELSELVGSLILESSILNVESLTGQQRASADGAKLFSVDLICGTEYQHDFGVFTMSLVCDIDLQEGKDLRVWRIEDNGDKVYATNVVYQDGVVSFDADHLSIYAVGYESDSSDDPTDGDSDSKNDSGMLLYAGIGAMAALIALGAVFVIRRRN